MDRDATPPKGGPDLAVDSAEGRIIPFGNAFWQMQALFGKLRAAARTVKEEPPPPPAPKPQRARRRRRGRRARQRAMVVNEGSRPAWLGPDSGQGAAAVTPCAWAVPTSAPKVVEDDRSAREILGLAPDAGPDEIKRRYRELAKDHHPDRGGSHDEFLNISRAYADALGQLLA